MNLHDDWNPNDINNIVEDAMRSEPLDEAPASLYSGVMTKINPYPAPRFHIGFKDILISLLLTTATTLVLTSQPGWLENPKKQTYYLLQKTWFGLLASQEQISIILLLVAVSLGIVMFLSSKKRERELIR